MGITKTQKILKSSTFNDFHDSFIESTVPDAQNPFMRILNLDLLVLLTVGCSFRQLLRVITPMFRIIAIVSCAITLILTFLFIRAALNDSLSRELKLTEQLRTTNYLLQQKLGRLKTKTLDLDLAIRNMNSQLNAARVDFKNNQEALADFASESAGGSIIDTPGTKSYHDGNRVQTLFGIPIWKPSYFTPRKVIQPWNQAGECWAFYGAQGKIEIELAYTTFVNGVTMEHIPVSASLTGRIDSAPREFRVLGKFLGKYTELGRFMYRKDGPPSQRFRIMREDMQNTSMKQIMLEIISNWGSPDYTCIYRFKVHGKISNNLPIRV